jgi:catechol 2,3-dioxygenase-like lactoylglutathione lyase family enzyme
MRLNHLDLQVEDVPAIAAFLERYFGLTIHGNRTSPAIIILSDDGGFTLVVQRRKRADEAYPEGFHIGFLVDGEEAVHRQHTRMVVDGVSCTDVFVNNRGVMFYLTAPGGVTVEVGHRPTKRP